MLLDAEDVLQGGTSATQRQQFHTDDINQCLHNKSSSRGVLNLSQSQLWLVLLELFRAELSYDTPSDYS